MGWCAGLILLLATPPQRYAHLPDHEEEHPDEDADVNALAPCLEECVHEYVQAEHAPDCYAVS